MFQVCSELYQKLEKFTCHLYDAKSQDDVNKLRYELFCSRKGKIESSQLPPCQHCLMKHIDRANYQTLIWKLCREQYSLIAPPEENGWKQLDGQLVIDWMTTSPAPNTILEFLSCGCKKSCDNNKCKCRAHGLKCTDMCTLKDCSNFIVPFEENESDESDSNCNDSESEEEY